MDGALAILALLVLCLFVSLGVIAFEGYATNNKALLTASIATIIGAGMLIFMIFKSGAMSSGASEGSAGTLWNGLKGLDIKGLTGSYGHSKRKRGGLF